MRLARSEPAVSVVIPALNEARNLELLLSELSPEYEAILVDGHSVDGTAETALRIRPDIRVVKQTRRGKGNALACGFLAASGDVIVMLDADGSADPSEIPRFVSALVAGADFAKGSRFCPGGGSEDITRIRGIGNGALCRFANVLFGTRYTDLCYGYNAFWRDIVPVLELPAVDESADGGEMLWGDGFEIESLINCRIASAGLKIAEVPSVERERWYGVSNLHAVRDGTRVLRVMLAERRAAHAYRMRCASARKVNLPPRTDLILDGGGA